MYPIVRNTLFLLPPETAHEVSMKGLDLIASVPFLNQWMSNQFKEEAKNLSKTVFGLHFPNPVGLGAGFDKNAAHLDALAMFGIWFC